MGTPSPNSRERFTKWLHGHYLLNAFKASVAMLSCYVKHLLKMLSLLSVVLRFLDDKMILMKSYLSY